jgi:hypothetical protein
MATTTTNFGWDIPQSTDLVKDGATAIAALGQDIDTAMVDLKGGTTGQVLAKASGTDLDFSWATPASAKVLQVVQASYSTAKTIASTTLTDTDLTASITPSASTSKVLVMISQPFLIERDSQGVEGYAAILRGGTTIVDANSSPFAYYYQSGSQADLQMVWTYNYLDSPATTSATTYKTQMRINATSLNGQVTANKFTSTIILMEIGA